MSQKYEDWEISTNLDWANRWTHTSIPWAPVGAKYEFNLCIFTDLPWKDIDTLEWCIPTCFPPEMNPSSRYLYHYHKFIDRILIHNIKYSIPLWRQSPFNASRHLQQSYLCFWLSVMLFSQNRERQNLHCPVCPPLRVPRSRKAGSPLSVLIKGS